MNAIEVDDLRVRYVPRGLPPVDAVRGASFTVAEGEIFAVLGPNGAGKTSTLEVLEGYRRRGGGTVRVLGRDPGRRSELAALRREVGIVLQDIAVEPYLKVREAVERNAGYYTHPRPVREVVELVGLSAQADARVKSLSGGQQRRLDLALGIVGRPRLLFLDEPTTGFDPQARRDAWEAIRELRALGTTIVLTTHYMDEAQALADRVCVLADGRVVATGAPADLGGREEAPATVTFTLPPEVDPSGLPSLAAERTLVEGDRVQVTTSDPTRTLHSLTGWALQRGLRLGALEVSRPSLEDVYLRLTSSEPPDGGNR